MEFQPNGCIGAGSARLESEWGIRQLDGDLYLDIRSASETTCCLKLEEGGIWRGRWDRFEQMPVEVYPQPVLTPVNGEIDVVYTWVDGDASAPALRALLDRQSEPVLRAPRPPTGFVQSASCSTLFDRSIPTLPGSGGSFWSRTGGLLRGSI